MNALKQRWKDFGVFAVKKYGYDNLNLEEFEMDVKIFMPTKRRFDLDNFGNNKLLLDAFTQAGFIVDDDSQHLKKITISGGYDKDNPRTEITITTLKSEGNE